MSSETPELGTRRTSWPQAGPLQQAADKVRAADPELAAWLEETANSLSWLAPYRDHEPGHGMWQAAEAMARRINDGSSAMPIAERAESSVCYGDGRGSLRIYCLTCPRPDDVNLPYTVASIDQHELCCCCGRNVIDVARGEEASQ